MKIVTALSLALALVAVACTKQEAAGTQAATPQAAASAAAAPAGTPTATPAAAPTPLAGKVLETFNAAGYSYVRVDTPSGEQWAAVRETKIEKGQDIAIDAQMTMENFESKTLKRTFDKIVFGALAGEAAGQAAAMPGSMAGGPPMGAQGSAMGSAAEHMKTTVAGDVKVAKAEGGRTIAEVWAAKASLGGKEVLVRGKVVKFNGGIMGRNWMHIQDGTGTEGTNDLTVTTDQTAAVGDVVTVRGTLAIDKDFGSGYVYPVIVEKASVTK